MKISITKKLAGMVIAGSTAIFTMMPMTAFAQVPEEEAQVCICETKCDEEHIIRHISHFDILENAVFLNRFYKMRLFECAYEC